MMEIRRLMDHEFEAAICLANRVFRESDHLSMVIAFPQVFSKQLHQSFGAFDHNELVAFMGLVPSTVKIGEAVLHVFSIGAVCTREDYRGRGIGTDLLNEVNQYIKRTTASLIFVSGDRGMYLRNGCYHFGGREKYAITEIDSVDHYAGSIRLGNAEDIFEIDRIRRMKDVAFESSLWEWHVLLEAGGFSSIAKSPQQLFVAIEGNRLEGYAVISMPREKNVQQQAFVVEWGGNPKAVYAILQQVLRNDHIREIELTVMWHEEFTEDLTTHSSKFMYNGGTVAIANVDHLQKQLMPYLLVKDARLALRLSVDENEAGLEIDYGEGTKKTVTMKEFIQLLFNPQNRTESLIDVLFPIPIPNTEGLYFV